jgi:hypothetical protein
MGHTWPAQIRAVVATLVQLGAHHHVIPRKSSRLPPARPNNSGLRGPPQPLLQQGALHPLVLQIVPHRFQHSLKPPFICVNVNKARDEHPLALLLLHFTRQCPLQLLRDSLQLLRDGLHPGFQGRDFRKRILQLRQAVCLVLQPLLQFLHATPTSFNKPRSEHVVIEGQLQRIEEITQHFTSSLSLYVKFEHLLLWWK